MIILGLVVILIMTIVLEIKYSQKVFNLERQKFIQQINKQNQVEWIKYKQENFKK